MNMTDKILSTAQHSTAQHSTAQHNIAAAFCTPEGGADKAVNLFFHIYQTGLIEYDAEGSLFIQFTAV